MPYISPARRAEIRDGYIPVTPGELNYAIHLVLEDYIDNHLDPETSYSKINEVVGVLECVKQEFYRRLAVPYENKKREQNGDIELYR